MKNLCLDCKYFAAECSYVLILFSMNFVKYIFRCLRQKGLGVSIQDGGQDTVWGVHFLNQKPEFNPSFLSYNTQNLFCGFGDALVNSGFNQQFAPGNQGSVGQIPRSWR